MTIHRTLVASLLAAFAFTALPTVAAEEKAPEVKAEKAAATPVAPHSHVTEKTGVPAPKAAEGKKKAKKATHDHQTFHK